MSEKNWYIVNTQSGCEATAKLSIEDRIKRKKMSETFGEIIIPAENVMELVKGKKTTKSRKFFPGYIFVQMEMSDESWHLVKGSTKVSGFVTLGDRPSPLPQHEVDRITKQMETGATKVKPKFNFALGEDVVVVDGPFNNFNGTVEEINEEKGKIKVLVSIFGRPTPVELDFVQVEKA